MSLFGDCLRSHRVVGLLYIHLYLAEIFVMQDFADQDLQFASKRISQGLYPQFPQPAHLVESSVYQFLEYLRRPLSISTGTTWHLKIRTLPALQIFYFRNLHLLSKDLQSLVLDAVAGLLKDVKIEVSSRGFSNATGSTTCCRNFVRASSMFPKRCDS